MREAKKTMRDEDKRKKDQHVRKKRQLLMKTNKRLVSLFIILPPWQEFVKGKKKGSKLLSEEKKMQHEEKIDERLILLGRTKTH